MRPAGRFSLTLRLTLLFALASTVVLTALGLLLSSSLNAHFVELDAQVLVGKLELVRHGLSKVTRDNELADLSDHLGDALVGHPGLAVVIADPDGRVLFANSDARFPRGLLVPQDAEQHQGPLEWQQGSSAYRGISMLVPTVLASSPAVVVGVATDTAHHDDFLRGLFRSVWVFVGCASLATGLLGWAAARRGLAPLRAMRDHAAAITAQKLDRRLPVESVPAELAELAGALNAMLGRLEDAFARLSEFSSDLAHELRTPISNLMMQTQVALSRARSADEYRAVLESNAEEFDRLARMVSDMLFLARAEHGLAVPRREALALAREISNLFDYYDALAEQRGIALRCEGDAAISGDKLMIRRALGNLLSNAIRHSPDGATVRVRLGVEAARARISVENAGDPIPADQLERIFDRFHRLDASRRHSGEGAGLGLAITRSIVAAHRGTVSAASSAEGTVFTIEIPLPEHDGGGPLRAPEP